jgi:hypothetical protein
MQYIPGAIYPRVKWLGLESDHSPPSSGEVKNGGAIPPLSHMSSWCRTGANLPYLRLSKFLPNYTASHTRGQCFSSELSVLPSLLLDVNRIGDGDDDE